MRVVKAERRGQLTQYVLVSLLFIFASINSAGLAETVSHHFRSGNEDVCLSHESASVGYYLEGRPSPFGNAPRFLVPAPYLTPEKTDDPQRTGIGATFQPLSDISYQSRIIRRLEPPAGACLEEAFDYGLVSLKTNEDYQPEEIVPARCRVGRFELSLVPEDKSLPFKVDCPLMPRTGSCAASFAMGNGWEAQFSMSVANLNEWEDHVSRVVRFFEKELIECEAK